MQTRSSTRNNNFATGGKNFNQKKGTGNRFQKNKFFGNKNVNRKRSFGFKRGKKKNAHSNFDPSAFISKSNPDKQVKEQEYIPTHTFREFELSPLLVATLEGMGIKKPTPIQDKIIPEILKGKNVIGLAETGTGKTAAFLLPILEKKVKNPKLQTLIVTPTRELSTQIESELKKLGRKMRVTSIVCVGGVGIRPQISALRQKPQFIIGTPGRLLDLINRKNLVPENISTVVLDEADRMLDMGFINDIRAILSRTPKTRSTHLFSATMTSSAEKLVQDFLQDPVRISVKKKDTTEMINQDVVIYSPDNKYETLIDTLQNIKNGRVIIFGAMKHSVEKLSVRLKQSGHTADSIHGDKSYGQRKRSLDRFKSGQATVLVATDVAARGIHVNNVTHVINYDLPNCFEDYIHRIGRTGRANCTGKALTFISEGQMKNKRRN